MIPEVKLKSLKQSKSAVKKCKRKLKKALRAQGLTELRMALGMAQIALRKIETSSKFNSKGEYTR